MGLPTGFEKRVLKHCGGAGHHPHLRRDYPELKSQRCRKAGHSQKFCPHRLEKKKWQYACRLLRTNILKEGAI
jgi:hypothetical protein